MSLNYDLTKYVSNSVMAGGSLFLYNMLVDGRGYKDRINLYDTATMMGSVVISKLAKDIIMDFVQINNNGIQNYLIEPAINAIVYSYGYEQFVKKNFNVNERTTQFLFFIGGLVGMISNFLENPIIGLLTGLKIY